MGLINTITALEEGCDIIDATITGMGRGAGNLKMELLLTYLESQQKVSLDFNNLGRVVSSFENLNKKYGWGTNLPYMFSGAHSLPQKEVMEWVGMNRYSLSSILNALNNKKLIQEDNVKLPLIENKKTYSRALIIGGGKSATSQQKAIEKFLTFDENVVLIHVGARNISAFSKVKNDQYFALVGIENHELLQDITISNKCVYGPFPRTMGTSIPNELLDVSFELKDINFSKASTDSPFTIAVQLALDLDVKDFLLVGFDGYDISINQNQFLLAQENQKIIDDLGKIDNVSLYSINPTKYENIELTSIYSFLK
jgi:4-hydroxy 2-oxovalerate aldolase